MFAPILVPYLIQHHHANITLVSKYGRIPLHYVVHPELVPLLSTPELINHRDNFNDTLLSLSIRYPSYFPSPQHYFQVVTNLLSYGADINIPNNCHHYPIHAIFRDSTFKDQPIDVIALLIQQHNINLNVTDQHDLTPLQLAIDRFVDPNYINDDENDQVVRNATSDEMRLKAIQSLKLLLQYNADITVKNSGFIGGSTILHYITHSGFYTNSFNAINQDLVEEFMEVIMEGITAQVILKNIDTNTMNNIE